jgi:hypothetical protein
MALMMMAGTVMMVIGYYLFLLFPVTPQAKDAASAQVVAATLLVHQKAAVDWCLRTACPDGAVPLVGLTLPPGYGAASWVRSLARGGVVATYATGLGVNNMAVATRLGDLSAGGPTSGLTGSDGTIIARDLVSPVRVAVPVIAGIPIGAPVISQKVK